MAKTEGRADEGWREQPEGVEHSWGPMSERHWSRAREGRNLEAIEHYRRRSRAPGVAEGGGPRNHYCLECDGVIPLEYDRRDPVAKPERCPHCGAPIDPRVQAMFNWVEIDRAPGSDLAALLPVALAGIAALVVLGIAAYLLLG